MIKMRIFFLVLISFCCSAQKLKWLRSPVHNQLSIRTLDSFGAKNDFVQVTASTNGTTTITVSGYSLSSADIGKVISIFDCHINSSYSGKVISFTTTILSVTNSTTCIISSAPSQTVSGKKCYIGTNNFDIFQNALDYCYTNQVDQLTLSSGTYYIVPSLSTTAPTQGSIKGLRIQGNLVITGAGKSSSKLKFGAEDISQVSDASVLQYKGFYFKGNGIRTLQDFTLEGADRTTTAIVNFYTVAVYTDQIANISMQNTFKNFDITSKDGWGFGFSSSRGGSWDGVSSVTDWYTSTFTNSNITAHVNPLNYFSQDGPTKKLFITNCVFDGGGGLPMPNMNSVASMTSGSNILNISNTDFSFYDLRSQNSIDDRKYNVIINGTFNAKIVSVNSPTQVVLDTNAPSNFTNVNITFQFSGGDLSENHTMYIHPNITYSFDNLQLNNTRKLSLHQFSGGGVAGIPLYQTLNRVSESPDNTLSGSGGMEFDTNLASAIIWDSCDFKLTQADIYDVVATYTNIRGGQHYGNANLDHCTGTFDHRGLSKTVSITNSVFGSNALLIRGTGSSYTLTNVDTPFLAFQEVIGSFSMNATYFGYLNILTTPSNIPSFPSITISNITAKGVHTGFPFWDTPLTGSDLTAMQAKFTFINCTFDPQ